MTSGRTSPALCGCLHGDGKNAGEYVIKLRGAVNVGGLVNELLASRLAPHFGLSCPDAALISFGPDLIELIAEVEPSKADLIRQSGGLNFGTRLLIGFSTWPVDFVMSEVLREVAAEVFAFDALVQNPDRRFSNPNILVKSDDLMLIDHELAFSFLQDIFPSENPWTLDRQNYLTNHVFYRQLRSKLFDLSRFTANLAQLTEAMLSEVFAELPPEWNNEGSTKIKEHLSTVGTHAEEFAEQIRRFLA